MASDSHRVHMADKPHCCQVAPRGHCSVHCARIEDVLYSQRKGKTNKGAQRWRCKTCGTKWTSKGLIPPIVPDTLSNIGYGSGPEDLSMEMASRAGRPFKKSRVIDQNSASPSGFSSLFGQSPPESPMSSPPSPSSSMMSAVPSGRSMSCSAYSVPSLSQSSSLGGVGPTKPVVMVGGPGNNNIIINNNNNNRPLSYSSSQVQQMSMSSSSVPVSSHGRPMTRLQSKSLAASTNNSPTVNTPSPINTKPKMVQSHSTSKLPYIQTSPFNNNNQPPQQQQHQQQSSLSRSTTGTKSSSIHKDGTRSLADPFGMSDSPQTWSRSPFAIHNAHGAPFVPSNSIIECLQRAIHSMSVFSNEISAENRVRLCHFFTILSAPSSESHYNSPATKNLLSAIDGPLFTIAKNYQTLYQRISRHHSAMEDSLVPLGEVFFDENEVASFLEYMDRYQPLEEIFEAILQEVTLHRDALQGKKDSIEASFNDPTLLNNLMSASTSGGSDTNMEHTRNETIRILDSLAPLESTLTNIEGRFRAVQKELNFVQKVQSLMELLYSIHIQTWKAIIDKHQRMIQNYIIDVIQQTLCNADRMSFAYNVLRSMNQGSNRRGDPDLDQSLIDSTNPFVLRLTDLLSKYESNRIRTGGHASAIVDRKVLAVYHSQCLDHSVPEDHPESPKRLTAVIRAINEFSKQTDRLVIKSDPDEVNDKWILTVHSADYLRQLDEMTEKLDHNEIRALSANDGATQVGGAIQFSPVTDTEDGDTFVSKHSLKAARRAVGATLCAVDQVMKGAVTSAFVAARPPGHHAGREGLTSGTNSQGFCLLNNVAIAGKYAQLKYGVEKIAVVDFDVHHGNGTEEVLVGDPGFLFLSIHMFEEGFYPGSGGGKCHGVILPSGAVPANDPHQQDDPNMGAPANNIVNIPLDPKSTANAFLKAFSIIIDKLNDYQPDLLLISCGFDAHIDDHLASLCLLEENYIEITRLLRQVADRWCNGRLISVLEGGYNISALKQCTIAHLTALTEDDNQ
ncbi:hypothetical protein SAMD00019534_120760 [Acytostelium subglobosum LB1]|uniref:hypothetical protein n=1 Tax=Acytostelium subglobosum LB1 TaxID=1410327 RepID=UPI000644FCF1|nr:hypothetical protein SAMD00019534_120760 [Acytostelium subglobosum LB1]GAM28900.1 hypothetical protein SAMD00019534_120760 [Acytostelium subglobosum LB1]|eukprot:XP_012748085.1 hypothetical protein SAMD00019534_120760 [Acytostelium subglobosum LB1]